MTATPRKGRTSKAETAAPEPEEAPEPSFIAFDPSVDDPDFTPATEPQPRRSDLLLELRRPLAYGSHGPNVDRVMRALAGLGFYEGPIDGRYGTRLSRAVRRFQSEKGLRVSGDVDGATWLALMEGYTEPAVAVEVPETPDDTEPVEPQAEPGDEVADEPITEPAVEDAEG